MKSKQPFTATGTCSDLLDVCDNLAAELHRLSTLSDLLITSNGETPSGPEFLPGVGLLLSDICGRMEAILTACHRLLPKKPSKR